MRVFNRILCTLSCTDFYTQVICVISGDVS